MNRFTIIVLLTFVQALCIAEGKAMESPENNMVPTEMGDTAANKPELKHDSLANDPGEAARNDRPMKVDPHVENRAPPPEADDNIPADDDEKGRENIESDLETEESPHHKHHKHRHHHRTPEGQVPPEVLNLSDNKEIPELPPEEEDFHSVPMPTSFQAYDVLHKDGFITLDELISVTGAVENVDKAFAASDIDGDGRLSREEFQAAPWMLQGDPTNSESKEVAEAELESPETKPSNQDTAGSADVTTQGPMRADGAKEHATKT